MTCPSDMYAPRTGPVRSICLAVVALLLVALGLPAHAQSDEPGHSKGSPDAPVTLVEYGSVTCSTCKYFHEEVLPSVLTDYVETGRVRFVFREFTRNSLDTEIMVLARCAGPDKFFDVVDDAFNRQDDIITAAQNGTIEDALMALGERHGVDRETGFNGCRNNFDIRFDISVVKQSAALMGIQGTPTFLINDTLVPWSELVSTPEALSARLDAELEKAASNSQ